ncbi:hypothetical protein EAS64_04235 [Trebonia kvetii]|uniref:ABM domain-containing protein n=1 Tax=Trebonia kvetii TaxID=2480626 RepID=A0A6P2C5E9_9ACTN|nr:hypothetical protein [Trebonia kvetii]TVZ06604.1 hypothetical protein EAS64_04235 [Trebonia kvetii]
MLHVEVNRVTGDPHRLNDAISYATTELRPVLEYRAGNLGTLLLTDPGADGMAFQSFWASSGALADTEDAIVAGIREAARLAGGRATREHYAVIVFEHEAPLRGGQGVRVTEMNVDPPKLIHVEDAVAWYGATVVPELADTCGFRAALLYAQWDSGHLISTTVWQDPQTLATSRTTATQGEAAAVSALDGVITASAEYRLAFSSARAALRERSGQAILDLAKLAPHHHQERHPFGTLQGVKRAERQRHAPVRDEPLNSPERWRLYAFRRS